jgi:hypothetical protein
MTHAVAVRIKPQHVLPDLFDWLDAQRLGFGTDWTFTRAEPTDTAHYVFEFEEPGAAVAFTLKWK